MPDAWMTVAEAATASRCHTRTIERRIAGGKLRTRRTEDGTLHVQINLPDTVAEPAAAETNETAFEAVRELAADHVSLATGSASALVKFAQDDAARTRDELILVRQHAQQSRRSAAWAWSVVGVCAVGVTVATGWTASRITRADADVRQMTDAAAQIRLAAKDLENQRDAARLQAAVAERTAAEMSGKLAAYVEQNQKLAELTVRSRPTTGPAAFVHRLAEAMAR